ncbi:MAG TPA: Gfo/Idh/MocA family oxidoreductase [Bryobacteraceae bacterium]|jgi:hypothetical protein
MNRLIVSISIAAALAANSPGADLRLGIVGTDTSHVIAFASALNDPGAKDHLSGGRIVLAYKGGSPEVEDSRSRIDRFAAELQNKFGVRFVDRIDDLCGAVDGILIESVDPRAHLAQMTEALKCGEPIFVDKPVASTLDDAREIMRRAAAAGVPWFSASSLRFGELQSLEQEALKGAIVWGPGPTEEHQALDLSWYGIHAAEMLYGLMGRGCIEVTRTSSEAADVVTCRWQDGRLGTMRIDRPYSKFGAVVFRSKNRVDAVPNIKVDYLPLLRKIVQFMQSKIPPVSNAETLDVISFLDAAQRSKQQDGKPVAIQPAP